LVGGELEEDEDEGDVLSGGRFEKTDDERRRWPAVVPLVGEEMGIGLEGGGEVRVEVEFEDI
jgi:hypothetical protein